MTTLTPRYRTEAERLDTVKDTLVAGMTRYPIVSKTILRSVVQVTPYMGLKGVINTFFVEPDELAGGRPYLSMIPYYRGFTRSERYYLTRYESILAPFFQPQLVESPDGEQEPGRQRMLEKLDLFPILSPTLMQAALGPASAKYFKPDLEYFIKENIITVWHPDLLNPNLAESTYRSIHAHVTHRGVRYFLTKYSKLLQPFLVE